MARQNALQQLSDYRGVLHWNSYTDGALNLRAAIDIPLYIKEHPIPLRKQKLTEINTIPMMDVVGQRDTSTQALFWGTPDLLQIQINGFLVTPTAGSQWAIPEYPDENVSYAEIISGYIEGRLNLTAGGMWRRKDPDYYISPGGQKYVKPIISVWEPQYTPVRQKQQFSMTLLLEK